MPNRVSLKQVAQAAGVSISTASMALSGQGRVNAETRAKVAACAHDLGYVRDPFLSSLAGGRFRHQGRAAIIACWISEAHWLQDLIARGAAMGMTVRQVAGPLAEIPHQVATMGASALVVHARGIDPAAFAQLAVPCVLWSDENPADLLVDVIETCDWWAATSAAIVKVGELGYRRPAMVLTPARPHHWHDDLRLAVSAQMGVPALEWDRTPAALAAFIERQRPDVVIGGIPHVHEDLEKLGLHLPFASLIVLDIPYFANIAGWVIDQPHRNQVTLEVIEQRLRYGQRPPRRLVIPPLWREARSLPSAAVIPR